jgi:exosortase
LKGPAARKIVFVAGLFIFLFRFNLVRLWGRTNPFTGDPNWGHGLFVPLIGLIYLYVNRKSLRQTPARPAWSGLAVILAGIGVFVLGIWPSENDYWQDIGMLLTLFGVVLLWAGWGVMKVAWFPIVFLLCAIPWTETFYDGLARPLQRLAAHVAVAVLSCSGVDAERVGTKIYMYGVGDLPRILNVAEACSGLRSLVTFVTLGAAVAFLFRRPLWQRIVITLAAVPIAVFCNVVRVAGQGLLDHYVSERFSQGTYHEVLGICMFIPGFLLILLVAKVAERFFIEEENGSSHSDATPELMADHPAEPAAGPGPAPRAAAARRWQPPFVAVVLVLGLSAAGLEGATWFGNLSLLKVPVALVKPLDTLPARLGPWQQVGPNQILDADVEGVLGTQQYVIRDYLDRRRVDAGLLARLNAASQNDRDEAWSQIRATCPQAVLNAAVTYYSGAVENVFHVPEACYPADGFFWTDKQVVSWPIGGRQTDVRLIRFEDHSNEGRPARYVSYFFEVNGRRETDPSAVRGELHDPFDRNVYFAKVELAVLLDDPSKSARVMQDFLASAWPEIEKCLPDRRGGPSRRPEPQPTHGG